MVHCGFSHNIESIQFWALFGRPKPMQSDQMSKQFRVPRPLQRLEEAQNIVPTNEENTKICSIQFLVWSKLEKGPFQLCPALV
jgi:hypothetical protein